MKTENDIDNSLAEEPKRASKVRKTLKNAGAGVLGALMGLSTFFTPETAIAQSVQHRPGAVQVRAAGQDSRLKAVKDYARAHESSSSAYKRMFKGLDDFAGFPDGGAEERLAGELLERFPSLGEDIHTLYLIARNMPTQLRVDAGESLAEAVNNLVYEADPQSLFSDASPKQQDNAVMRAHEAMRQLSPDAQRRYTTKARSGTVEPVEDAVMIGLVRGYLEAASGFEVSRELPEKPDTAGKVADEQGRGQVREAGAISMPSRVTADEIEVRRKAELEKNKSRLDQMLESGDAPEDAGKSPVEVTNSIDRCEIGDPYARIAEIYMDAEGMIKKPGAKVTIAPDAILEYKEKMLGELRDEYAGCEDVLEKIEKADRKLDDKVDDYRCRPDMVRSRLERSESEIKEEVAAGRLTAKEAFGAREDLEDEIRKECPADEYARTEGIISASDREFDLTMKQEACGTSEDFNEKLEGTDLTKLDGFTNKDALDSTDPYMKISEVEAKLEGIDSSEAADPELCPDNRSRLEAAKADFYSDAAGFLCDEYAADEIQDIEHSYTLELKDPEADIGHLKAVAGTKLDSLAAECTEYAAHLEPGKAEKLEETNRKMIDNARSDLDSAAELHAKVQKNRIITTISVEGHDPSFESEAGSGEIYARVKNSVDAERPLDASLFLEGGYDDDSLKTAWSAGGVLDFSLDSWSARFGFAGGWPDFRAVSSSMGPGMLEIVDEDNYTELISEIDDAKAAENNRSWSLEMSVPVTKNVDIRASYAFTKSRHSEDVQDRSSNHKHEDVTEVVDGQDVRRVLDVYVDSEADVDVESDTEMHSAGIGADFRLGDWTIGGDVLAHYAESDVGTRTDSSVTTRTDGFVEVMGERMPLDGAEETVRDTSVQEQKYIQRVVDAWAHAMYDGEAAAGWLAVGVPSVTGQDDVPKGDSVLPVMFDVKGFYHDGSFLIGGGATHVTDNLDLNLYIASDAKTRELLSHIRNSSSLERVSVMDQGLRQDFLEKGLEYSVIQDSDGWYVNAEAELALRDDADSAGRFNARVVTPVMGDVFRLGVRGSKDFTDSSGFSAGADAYFRLGSRSHTLKLGAEARDSEHTDSTEAGVNIEYVLRF